MSQHRRRGQQIVARERVGQFHFAPVGSRQFRLVAVLYKGDREIIHTAPTIGDLWRQPWLVTPELESEVVDLRVECLVEQNGRSFWKPLLESLARPRDIQD